MNNKADKNRSDQDAIVTLAYDVEIGDAIEMKELPFVIGVLADLSGRPEERLPGLRERKFVEIDRDNFNAVLEGCKPRAAFKVDNTLEAEDSRLAVELRFKNIDDFRPESVAEQVPQLSDLLTLRTKLADMRSLLNYRLEDRLYEILHDRAAFDLLAAELRASDLPENGILKKILEYSRLGQSKYASQWNQECIEALLGELLQDKMRLSKDIESMLTARIDEIDRILSNQLNKIMHHPDFQKLEATWRGLEYLINHAETSEMLRIRVLNARAKDILRDFEKAIEPSFSTLHKKVYEEEFGMFGGTAYNILIGDYYFDNSPQAMGILRNLSSLAASTHVAVIAAAAPAMFNMDSFKILKEPRDLWKIFQIPEYAAWRRFRESDYSRRVSLVLPRLLLRLPYGESTTPVKTFNYNELVNGPLEHEHYLWGNSAFALGLCITRAFARYHWCAAIRGVEGGGLIAGLPLHAFESDQGDIAVKCPTEIAITERREKELADLGFIPLVYCKGTDFAAYFSTQTAHKPKVYDTDAANADARITSRLEYVLTQSRFAHYFMSMMRDKIGSFMTRKNAEEFLNRWISNYVAAESSDNDSGAKRPLKQARVNLEEIRGKPGAYRAIAYFLPFYQLDETSACPRLIVELPPPASG